jgi:ABC-type dipeptide/oligopeptide/nickel transport system ATPase component
MAKSKNTNPMYSVIKNVKLSKEEIEKIPSYLMIRWLSGNGKTTIPANFININYNIPIYNQYIFLDDYFKLTNLKNTYIQYYKDTKFQITKQNTIDSIAKYYNVNYTIAENYYNLMDKKEHKKFENMYKEGKI